MIKDIKRRRKENDFSYKNHNLFYKIDKHLPQTLISGCYSASVIFISVAIIWTYFTILSHFHVPSPFWIPGGVNSASAKNDSDIIAKCQVITWEPASHGNSRANFSFRKVSGKLLHFHTGTQMKPWTHMNLFHCYTHII